MSALAILFRRELSLAWGRGGGPLLALGFLAAAVTLFPLALGPAPGPLKAVAEGVVWVALALAVLLNLERLFERDFEDGALDLLVLGSPPLEAVCGVKCIAAWLATAAPLALAAPLAAVALGEPPSAAAILWAAAALGGLAFVFIGGMGAALSLGSRRGGVLIAVIVLPLLVPPVIFGAVAVTAFAAGGDWAAGLTLLSAYALAAIALTPFAMAAACRNALG